MPGATRVVSNEAGYDGIWAAETSHDPFLTMTLVAAATEKVDIGTGIAVAFARNPDEPRHSRP